MCQKTTEIFSPSLLHFSCRGFDTLQCTQRKSATTWRRKGGEDRRMDFCCCFWLRRIDFHLLKNWANLNPSSNLDSKHLKPKASSQMSKKQVSVYVALLIMYRRRMKKTSKIWTHALKDHLMKMKFCGHTLPLLTWTGVRNYRCIVTFWSCIVLLNLMIY